MELFAGGGGLAMALHDAGFRHLLVNEFAPRACQTLLANKAAPHRDEAPLPKRLSDKWPLIQGDVREVDFTGLTGQVDLLAGGPPCQPFSLGGLARGDTDDRNGFPWFFRAMREIQPRAILCENVIGLMRPSFRDYFDYITRELSAPFEQRVEGESWVDHNKRLVKTLAHPNSDPSERYDVHVVPVNAADYGVPQLRRRVLMVAFRRDLEIEWRPPRATHSDTALAHALVDGSYWDEHDMAPRPDAIPAVLGPVDGLRRWRTLRDAIRGLGEPGPDKVEHPDVDAHIRWPGARIYAGHTPNLLDRPAKTVKAGVHGVPGGESVMRLDDGSIRYMTVRETARVMTFPDTWKLAGPRGEQMRQLGNAVPRLLGEVFATSVASALRGAR
ncbi:DNA cytosine methyltransferase [Angustibacter sp. Root456]|uniref:DNA cytosine methyltransferase n=1 Tax=Angustibacter sp. Root456 TaxID=1736539 RepID=UPI0019105D2B|nr:DNA cytosine methyltransferase [Angustibacter sp. Root456]